MVLGIARRERRQEKRLAGKLEVPTGLPDVALRHAAHATRISGTEPFQHAPHRRREAVHVGAKIRASSLKDESVQPGTGFDLQAEAVEPRHAPQNVRLEGRTAAGGIRGEVGPLDPVVAPQGGLVGKEAMRAPLHVCQANASLAAHEILLGPEPARRRAPCGQKASICFRLHPLLRKLGDPQQWGKPCQCLLFLQARSPPRLPEEPCQEGGGQEHGRELAGAAPQKRRVAERCDGAGECTRRRL
mmetsp:Transcript_1418/g.4113  ORF Transcript_1418/g.4113 Transcript_1418/m.4113 type:complete len:244 (-) Transcript_1418:113-844(-)